MTQDVSHDYGAMEEAIATFKQAASTVENIISEVNTIAKTLENDVLRGQAGDLLVQALRSDMVREIQTIQHKLTEMAGDIQRDLDEDQRINNLGSSTFNN